jgi:hypothetical protein
MDFSLRQIELTKWKFNAKSKKVSPEATLFIGWTLSTRKGQAMQPISTSDPGLTPLEKYNIEMKIMKMREEQNKQAWVGHSEIIRFTRNENISDAKIPLNAAQCLYLSELPDVSGSKGTANDQCHGELRVQVWEIFDEEKHANFLSNVFVPTDEATRKECEKVQAIKEQFQTEKKKARERLRDVLCTTVADVAAKFTKIPLADYGLSFGILQSTLLTAESLAHDLSTLTHDAPKLLGTCVIPFDYWKNNAGQLEVQWNVAGTSYRNSAIGFALPVPDTSPRYHRPTPIDLVHYRHDGEAMVFASFNLYTGVAEGFPWEPDHYIDIVDKSMQYL